MEFDMRSVALRDGGFRFGNEEERGYQPTRTRLIMFRPLRQVRPAAVGNGVVPSLQILYARFLQVWGALALSR